MFKKFFRKDYVWTFTTYFTEGFPFTVIRPVSSVFFRDMKVSLENIGLTSLFGLPWILKFLWAPLLDDFGTKRKWLLYTQGLLALVMLLAAFFASVPMGVPLIAGLFFVGAVIAATHDTAIDGYYMEALDKRGQAKFVGYRVMAYRIAMMSGTGVIVTIGTSFSWSIAFLSAALIFSIFYLIHLFYLREVQTEVNNFKRMRKQIFKASFIFWVFVLSSIIIAVRFFFMSSFYKGITDEIPILKKIWFSHWVAIFLLLSLITLLLLKNRIKARMLKNKDSRFSKSFFSFVDRDKIGIILLFIIFLRAGEFMLTTMVSPFIVDLGMKVHYGWISAGVGLPCSIGGALLGGWAISKYSLKRVTFPFILFQNSTNILYMFLAFYLSNQLIGLDTISNQSPKTINILLLSIVHGIEQFSGGMGTAVLMAFLMRLCKKEYKATHYAIGSGLMAVSGLFAGVASGFTASWLGYGWTFGLSFLIAAPALIAALFLPLDSLSIQSETS
jgi:MFS transporter, PAT family, beta-lactamase induction signal transducer AmpG